MSKLAVHFGAGNIGRGFIAPVLEENKYNIIFVDVNNELVSKLNLIDSYIVSNFSKQTSDHISVSNFSAIELIGLQELVAKRDLRALDIAEKHFNESRVKDYKIHEAKESFNFIPKKLNGPIESNWIHDELLKFKVNKGHIQ